LDRGRQAGQFFEMRGRQLVEEPPPSRSENQPHDPAVVVVDDPPDEAGLLGAVDQFDGAVVPEQEMGRRLADRGRQRSRMTPYREQQLMLLRGEAGGGGLFFAPPREPAQTRAELQQGSVLGVEEVCMGHIPSMARAHTTLRDLSPHDTILPR